MTEKALLSAKEVADILGVSAPMAYKLIREMNDELREKGYITVSGKISRMYFEEKCYISPLKKEDDKS